MPDEIETTEQLIALADLAGIVIHEVTAVRTDASGTYSGDLPPEELHAPDSPDDEAALSFGTRLDDTQLGVRCRVEASNAYGSFVVDGEALFDLPAPLSSRQPDIVHEFAEQIGAPVVFPYIRAAVAALAAQLSVPATPLPILHNLKLVSDDGAADEEEPSELFMHGTVTRTTEDGGQEHVAEFFLDEETGVLTRIGGEELGPDADEFELLNFIAELPPPEEITAEWIVRNHGEAGIRQSVESFRQTNGDAVTDQMLAEIDEAVGHIEAEQALASLHVAIKNLDAVIASVRSTDTDVDAAEGDAGENVSTSLLDAAEHVRDGWLRLHSALPD